MCVKYDVIEWEIFYEMVSSVANKLRPHMHHIPNEYAPQLHLVFF